MQVPLSIINTYKVCYVEYIIILVASSNALLLPDITSEKGLRIIRKGWLRKFTLLGIGAKE